MLLLTFTDPESQKFHKNSFANLIFSGQAYNTQSRYKNFDLKYWELGGEWNAWFHLNWLVSESGSESFGIDPFTLLWEDIIMRIFRGRDSLSLAVTTK